MAELNLPSGSAETAAGEPPDIPGHKLLRRIGRGSYGEVWLAQTAAGEYRAVKIVYRHTFERERPFEREFSGIQKFEPVSRAQPSQVSILQAGRDDEAGFFYYVMELADDETSGRQIDPANYKPRTLHSEVRRAGRIPYDRALDISLSLTKALEHLHQHGLIHRDIKPSNIIFVDGVPKLADIGLVTDVGASISYVGTEGFLPPEGPVSQQADIYSLGKVLYEMSTGQDRLDFPELPTFLGDPAEKEGLLELNLVFLKACQNDPQKRYRKAQEMYADLAILRSGKSLKRARAAERRLLNVSRAFAATIAVALIAGGIYYAWNQHRLQKLRDEVAEGERKKRIVDDALRGHDQSIVNLYLANGQKLAREDLSGALAWYARALQKENDPARAEQHQALIVRTLERFPKLVGFLAHPGTLNSAVFSRDASRVVTAGEDQSVRIWDVANGESVDKPLRHKSPVVYAELSPDQQRVFTICKDGTAWLWRVSRDETIAYEIPHGARVLAGQFSPNGRFVLTRGDDKQVIVWDGLSARDRFKFVHEDVPAKAEYSPDGRYIGVIAGPILYIWDTEGHKVAQAASPHGKSTHLAFSPDSRRVVVVAGSVAQICNVANGEWSMFAINEAAPITAAQFTPGGRSIITATEQGTARLWDSVTGKNDGRSWQFRSGLQDIDVSADGSAVMYATTNHCWVVDLKSNQSIVPPAVHQGSIRAAAFSSDARLLLTAGGEGAIWISELITGTTNDVPLWQNLSRDQLLAVTRLLSGREVNEQDQLMEIEPKQLLADWQRLRTNSAFAPLAPAAWHAARAERLYSDGLWFGVRFHAERLNKLNASDSRVRAWDEKAAQELARVETSLKPIAAIPQRSSETKANLIDLTRFYNAALRETWLPTNYVGKSNDLSHLPTGVQKFHGVEFDVRGLVQLSGTALENLGARFPQQVSGIPIDRKASKLHFLHGAAWDALYGTVIGKYRINYVNGEKHELKLVFGVNVRDWWFPPTQPQLTREAAVAWQGYNPASRHMGMAVRIYQYARDNPFPELEIESIDFISMMEKPAPFLLAITTEPAD